MTFELICHHYKFKSEAEFRNRTAIYDQNGYMRGKLSNKALNEKWNKRANSIPNMDIVHLVDQLKELMGSPISFSKKLGDDDQEHYLSIVAMIRGEEDYLDEWISFYIYQGADHFYLYINENTRSTFDKLEPYADKGFVTLISWPELVLQDIPWEKRRFLWHEYDKVSTQNLAFMDFNSNCKSQTTWIIKADVDEFIFVKNCQSARIVDVLDYSVPLISVPRINFGSNNHIKKPNGLVIENYTRSASEPSSTKSIALASRISDQDRGGAHSFHLL